MTWSNDELDVKELQDFTYRSLGRFLIAFANVEFTLSLRVGPAGRFLDKLERFYDMAIDEYQDSEISTCESIAWYMAADSIRTLRNRFAHGRWAFIPREQSVVHVVGYPPEPQEVRRFSLTELDAIVKDVERLGEELSSFVQWSHKRGED